jgi:hypothetical protein
MAYENIVLRRRNMVMVDGYFYSIDADQDALIVKTDDGTQAYSYPLDNTITEYGSVSSTPTDPTFGGIIKALEYDGRNFWSLENSSTFTNVTIKRWYIDNYVLKLRDTFSKSPDGTHIYSANAMSIEHYHIKFSADEYSGSSELSVTTDVSYITVGSGTVTRAAFVLPDRLASGMTVTFGPNKYGQVEEQSVNSVGADYININGTTLYDYETGDPISFYTKIWLFNNYDGLSSATGALYQLNAYTGSYIYPHYTGGAYKDINAATFFDMTPTFDTPANAICYVKATNLIFLDPYNFGTSYGSMTLDNLVSTQDVVIPIYSLTIEGKNVYRLQTKATYYGTTYNFNLSNFSYQLSTLQPFITSISLRANPAIVPANGVNQSTITAIVKDQFNNPIAAKPVTFTDDDPNGAILTAVDNTDGDGVATTQYKAGTTAREVKIVATAQQG